MGIISKKMPFTSYNGETESIHVKFFKWLKDTESGVRIGQNFNKQME